MQVHKGARLIGALVTMSALAACTQDNPVLEMPTNLPTVVEQPTSGNAANACPVEGCRVSIASVDKPEGAEELTLTFSANYTPEISGNHFHVYWSKFQANQVSDNAESEFGVTQGEWEPTADNPYTTTGAVAVGQRGDATQICVTPGDKDHNVIDPEQFECRDVVGLL